MIIASRMNGKPGDIIPKEGNYLMIDGVKHKVPFYIIRYATKEEYLNQCREEGISPGYINSFDKFYEISID